MRQNEGFSSSLLVGVLESAWSAIRLRHGDVPPVVLVVGSGSPSTASGSVRWGHFAASRWQHGSAVLSEVLVSGEGLVRPVDEVLSTLLHEAAHGVAFGRQVQDTSRQGRYHNKRFAAIAGELGLVVSEAPKIGWSVSRLGPGTETAYAEVMVELDAALQAFRHPEVHVSKTATRNGVVLVCPCERKIRASVKVAAMGPIDCGVCGRRFVEEPE